MDASEENDGYSSGEEPLNSDPEDESGRKLAPGKYTVVADCEKAGPQELSVKSGDVVQLIREAEEGQWFVKNLRSSKEGWVPAANLLSLISESKSSQSLSSSAHRPAAARPTPATPTSSPEPSSRWRLPRASPVPEPHRRMKPSIITTSVLFPVSCICDI